ncbi:polyprenyl synthetase family protein [Beutenbergia cavernae]|uniref:polyprenyl synthetase family protein n=1 Tax=Beutenbergia cavernae TaxID=84757 RepID=UPI001651A5CE|nr:polyprenyl synthetase family protein [Beutenbergia cavernae]
MTGSVDLAAVEAHLDGALAERAALTSDGGAAVGSWWRAVREACRGGKRVRPALVLAAFHGLRDDAGPGHEEGDPDGGAAVQVAAAFELLHAAFLLHDDVIDGDLVRRGRPNLIAELAEAAHTDGVGSSPAHEWGTAAAVLAGDVLIHAALHAVATADVPAEPRRELLELVDRCLVRTVAGEVADVAYAARVEVPRLPDVLRMTSWKTAAYSCEAPLVAGAILAGAAPGARAALADVGRAVGAAYQLRDDVLGTFGDELVTGKSTSSDLRGGKVTALVAYARHTDHAAELDALLALPAPGAAEIEAMRTVLVRSGALDLVEQLIDDLLRSALEALAGAELPPELREYLGSVARTAAAPQR